MGVPMNLGAFQSMVSTTLNRGTTLDSRIPLRVQMAAQWLERNYSFKYMEAFRLLQVVQGERVIDLPSNQVIKAWKFVRLIRDDGSYMYLNKVEPEDILGIGNPAPNATFTTRNEKPRLSAYWVVGNSQMVLNTVPDTDWSGEGMWLAYTDWPTDPSAEHPLMNMASDVLLAETLLLMAAFDLRDQRMVAGWKEIRDEGVNTLTRAEDENKYGGESLTMAFVPEPGGGLADKPHN